MIPTLATALLRPLADRPEDRAVVAPTQILLPHAPIPLQEQPRRGHLHERETPARGVRGAAVLLPHGPQLGGTEPAATRGVPAIKQGVEAVRVKMSVDVEHARVGAVLRVGDGVDEDPQPRVGEPAARERRRVREEDRDEQRRQREQDAEPQCAEAVVYVPRVDDAVVVGVPEQDVLLQGRQLVRLRRVCPRNTIRGVLRFQI